ncbi:MAG: ABC transporter permease [Proteobacteria bacterium]|nr:ABC transporter permease [Pseudomonadota bacterium]
MDELTQVFFDQINNIALYETVKLSLQVSLCSVFFASIVGLPLAAVIATTNFSGKRFIVIMLNTLMGLPPVVVGLLIYLLLSRAGPLGSLGILFTPSAMIIAQTILIAPIITGLARQIIVNVWIDYSEQLTSLGVPKRSIIGALLLDVKFSLVTIILAATGRALSEVGSVMIVGGNIDGVTRVMTTAIALETSKGNLNFAIMLGIILISVIFTINGIIFFIKEYLESKK